MSFLTRSSLLNSASLILLWHSLLAAPTPAAEPLLSPPAPDKETFWLIPHTHWEGAVFKTREEYLEMGLPNILTALRLLKENPNYRFALDQVAYFKPFLERYPEQAADFRRFVAEGRLQIVGSLNIMPDDNMPSGESFVRQILYGKGYAREALGVEVKSAWLLDTFGHHAQLPQILKLAGYNSFWFFRGVEDRAKMPSEFLWQGADGTRIPAFWLPFAYGHLYGPPRDLKGFSDFMQKRFKSLAPFSRGRDRVGLAGVDVSEPELYVPALVAQFNQQTNLPFTLRIGLPSDFEAVVARRTNQPIVTGERNPLFQGIYSSRIELKQRMRETERLLTSAEKLAALDNAVGIPTDDAMTWRAWEPVLFNVTHDLASGVMTDRVYEDTVRSYDFSQRLATEMLDTRLDHLLSKANLSGTGDFVAVFNSLGWPRTDLAEGELGCAESGIKDIEAFAPNGKLVPTQIVSADRFADGGLKRVKFAFLARQVPALGYSIYRITPLRSDAAPTSFASELKGTNALENESCHLDFDPLTGALTNLLIKSGNWSALAARGNVIARERDNGDFWELYKNLDGFQNVIMTRPLGVPKGDTVQFSDQFVGKPGVVRQGLVFSEFEFKHPFGSNTISSRVRLYAGLDRIDFQTRILNNEKHVRYRALFPSSIRDGKNVHEIPFGALERPTAQEFPAQNWIDYSDATHGLALLNRGLPGNNVADATLMLSLLRSTRIQSYGIGGGFEGQGSDSGLELGKELTFQYALLPHTGDWRSGQTYRHGLEFNNPLLTRKIAPHSGVLPMTWGLAEISPENVVLSALKPAKDGSLVIRVYEAAGQDVPAASITLHGKITSAHTANLMEDSQERLNFRDNKLTFDLHPFQIKTFKLRLKNMERQ
ncbi:MAG TPA: glycoside hydrolase family 38 C-terminal domain-containing protein [Verrucomicrobiae bacterium]